MAHEHKAWRSTPLLQKKSAETAVARSSRSFGGPGPHVFNFTCSATTGKAKNAPVLASKARLKRFASISFATTGFYSLFPLHYV